MMPPQPDPILPKSPDLESTEARMRRALGLADGGSSPAGLGRPDPQRAPSAAPSPDRQSSARPRPRFVGDGDVPVTLVGRPRQREADGPAAPSPGRLSVVEAALATERAKREAAERSLQDARATLRDLRTQLGHAELAWREASDAARAAQAGMDALRAEFQQREAGLHDELAAERMARAATDRAARVAAARHEAIDSRAPAERAGSAALASRPALESQAALPKRAAKAPAAGATKTGREALSAPKQREPQPVKWWLKTANKR